MKNISDIILNPVRMRIIQTIAINNTMTATGIYEKISDVPRTTIYRHIKILLENDILSVVSEQKIRGSLERTLAINTNEIVKQNTLENAAQNTFSILMKKYIMFQKYFNDENNNTGEDKVFINSMILMTTDEEFDKFLLELRDILMKYNFDYTKGRKARDITIISAPEEK